MIQDLEEVPEMFPMTGKDHDIPFLIENSLNPGEEGVLIFATASSLRWLSDFTSWYMDGTFKVALNLFRKLFTASMLSCRVKSFPAYTG